MGGSTQRIIMFLIYNIPVKWQQEKYFQGLNL